MTYEHRIDSERSPYAVQLDDLSLDAWDEDREHERAQAQRRGSEPGIATVTVQPDIQGAPAVIPALGVRSTDNHPTKEQHAA
jgi:hypothetical protein